MSNFKAAEELANAGDSAYQAPLSEESLRIKGYPNYSVTEEGQVYSWVSLKWLKQEISNVGYKRVCLSRKGIATKVSVHRLVAEAFVPNPNGLPHVNHLDNDKTNNRTANLVWCTPKENSEHMVKQGRHSNGVRTAPRKAECNYGHPMSGDNLYQRVNKHGFLVYKCRACANRWEKERQKRQRNTSGRSE